MYQSGIYLDIKHHIYYFAEFLFVFQVGKAVGKLRNFIIEPFVPHDQDAEAYVCIYSHRHGDTLLFTHEGGVDIGDVDAKALKLELGIDERPTEAQIKDTLLVHLEGSRKEYVVIPTCHSFVP